MATAEVEVLDSGSDLNDDSDIDDKGNVIVSKDAGENQTEESDAAEGKEEVAVIEEVKGEEKEKDEDGLLKLRETNIELRQSLREQAKRIAALEAKLTRVTEGVKKTKVDDDIVLDEDEPEGSKEESLSRIEQLNNTLAQLGQPKGPILESLIEVMELSPKYEDVREVCTRRRFDDFFEEAAQSYSKEKGIPYHEALIEVELSVWNRPNPYRYMYEIIKEHHPDFKVKETAVEKKEEVKKPAVTPKTTAKSIANMGGSGDGKNSGWTAAKIEELDYDEVGKVPKDVYDKYLKGLLA